MPEPIVMPNEGHERTEYCPRWYWENGSVSYGPVFSDPVVVQAFLDKPPVGVVRGEMVQRTVSITSWEPVLPLGVLRLDEVDSCEEYGGVKVAELGDGVVEGYNVVALTDDPKQALAAVRAHCAMVYNEAPRLALRWEDEPVRWWQVFGTCGCGDICPHGGPEDEDVDHDCQREGLPPCNTEGEASWIGQLAERSESGALPFVEIEVGASLTRDEQVTLLLNLLADAERRLRKLAKTCLVVKTTLDKPYSDAPHTTPWKQYVERPTRDAYNLAQEIKQELKEAALEAEARAEAFDDVPHGECTDPPALCCADAGCPEHGDRDDEEDSEDLPEEFLEQVRTIHAELTAPRVWVGPDPGADRALFVDAVRYVLKGRNARVYLVQRNVRVGFAKAARLVDLMESWGLVGPKTGPVVREVLAPAEAVEDVIAAITAVAPDSGQETGR